jgi:hypothetical protein
LARAYASEPVASVTGRDESRAKTVSSPSRSSCAGQCPPGG